MELKKRTGSMQNSCEHIWRTLVAENREKIEALLAQDIPTV